MESDSENASPAEKGVPVADLEDPSPKVIPSKAQRADVGRGTFPIPPPVPSKVPIVMDPGNRRETPPFMLFRLPLFDAAGKRAQTPPPLLSPLQSPMRLSADDPKPPFFGNVQQSLQPFQTITPPPSEELLKQQLQDPRQQQKEIVNEARAPAEGVPIKMATPPPPPAGVVPEIKQGIPPFAPDKNRKPSKQRAQDEPEEDLQSMLQTYNITKNRLMKEKKERKKVPGKEIEELQHLVKKCNDTNSVFQKGAGIPADKFVAKVFQGFDGLMTEFSNLPTAPPKEVTTTAWENNTALNRYRDVKCYDQSRVILRGHTTDYVHANFVDGYKWKNAYICCQGPTAKTTPEFWQMVWQEHVLVIAMVTRLQEGTIEKCFKYWPDENQTVVHGNIQIYNMKLKIHNNSTAFSQLIIKNQATGHSRGIFHMQFLNWPDYGVPDQEEFLVYLDYVRKMQRELVKQGKKFINRVGGPPIVIHCSAGVGRTGTVCAVDVASRKLLDCGLVDIPDIVRKLRAQRHMSIQKADQYVFVNFAVVQFYNNTLKIAKAEQ